MFTEGPGARFQKKEERKKVLESGSIANQTILLVTPPSDIARELLSG